MKAERWIFWSFIMSSFAMSAGGASEAGLPVSSGFTYQGQLKEGGVPYTGSADVLFQLFDVATGAEVGTALEAVDVSVVNGLFTVELEFEEHLFGEFARDLEISIRVPHDPADLSPFTILTPRQRLTPAPFANTAKRALTAFSLAAPDGDGLTTGARVGVGGFIAIGSGDPEVPLDVQASGGSAGGMFAIGEVTARFRASGGNSAISVDADAGLDSIVYLAENGLANWGVRSHPFLDDQFQIRFLRDNANATRLSIDSTGNVGIGTMSPTAKLDVAGTPGVDGIRFPDGTLQTTAAIADGHSLNAADDDPADAVFVDAIGNVGVGTMTPQDRLHIASGSAGGSLLLGTGVLLSKQDFGGTAHPVLSYDSSDNAEFFAPPNRLLSFRTGTGAFTSVRATITPAGRFGIGTTAPDVLLHLQSGTPGVSGTITASNLLLERNGDNYLSFMSPANRLSGLAFSRPGNGASELFHGAIIYNESLLLDALQFRTGGNVTRMAIEGDGDVGIGTTQPAGRMHVQEGSAGSIAPNADASLVLERSGNNYLHIYGTDDGETGVLFGGDASDIRGGMLFNSSATIGGLQFRTTGNVTRAVIDATGDVGIGTTSPGARLHVVDATGGNTSVILPSSAISAAEVLDEPGCAGTVLSGAVVDVNSTFPDPPESILSQSITVPTSGFVLAIATVGTHGIGLSTGAISKWGLTTDVNDIPDDQMQNLDYQPFDPGGFWSAPITLHRLFQVSGGTTTVHLMAQGLLGDWEYNKAQLSLVFFPTSYGTTAVIARPEGLQDTQEMNSVSNDSSGVAPPPEGADLLLEIRAERAALLNDIQVMSELRAELLQLRTELKRARFEE